jgi:hypothetical protein
MHCCDVQSLLIDFHARTSVVGGYICCTQLLRGPSHTSWAPKANCNTPHAGGCPLPCTCKHACPPRANLTHCDSRTVTALHLFTANDLCPARSRASQDWEEFPDILHSADTTDCWLSLNTTRFDTVTLPCQAKSTKRPHCYPLHKHSCTQIRAGSCALGAETPLPNLQTHCWAHVLYTPKLYNIHVKVKS